MIITLRKDDWEKDEMMERDHLQCSATEEDKIIEKNITNIWPIREDGGDKFF